MKQFLAYEERARLELARDKKKREKSVEPRRNEEGQRRSIPPLRRDTRIKNKVTGEILMISRGPMDRGSTNSRKMSLKKAQHEVLSGHLRHEEERSFTVAFSLV